jgi:hypothetical protein
MLEAALARVFSRMFNSDSRPTNGACPSALDRGEAVTSSAVQVEIGVVQSSGLTVDTRV